LNYLQRLLSNPEKINIDIKFDNYQKLAYLREEALRRGAIITEENSYVPVKVRVDEGEYKADIRLKGDVVNHVQGDKWSLRVKIKNGKTINGMSSFSLQDPKMSGFINEWIFHNLIRYEKIAYLINGI